MKNPVNNNFIGKRILVFTAHPDDESYAMAGAIFKNHLAGGKTFLACASLGEKGTSHLKKIPSPQGMKRIRKKELESVAKFLHISKLFIFNLPDGQIKFFKKELLQKGLAVARKVRADFIVSFGTDGISGHRDHIAVGNAAKAIAERLRIPFVSFSLPEKLTGKALEFLKSRRKSKHYAKKIVFGKPNFNVKIDGKIKKKSLSFHRSQMDGKNAFTGFPEYAVKELLKAEYFVK